MRHSLSASLASRPTPRLLLQVAIGAGCAALATATRLVFDPLIHNQIPFITYVAGAMSAASSPASYR